MAMVYIREGESAIKRETRENIYASDRCLSVCVLSIWRKTDEKRFQYTLRQELDTARLDGTTSCLFDPHRTATPPELDTATDAILEALITASRESTPESRPSPQAKPFWDDELDEPRDVGNHGGIHSGLLLFVDVDVLASVHVLYGSAVE